MVYVFLIVLLALAGPAMAALALWRSLSVRWHLIWLGVCSAYGSLPLLLTWTGFRIAELFDCEVEGVMVFQCPDVTWLGTLISGMVFTHWFAIVTIPSALLGALGLLISLGLRVN